MLSESLPLNLPNDAVVRTKSLSMPLEQPPLAPTGSVSGGFFFLPLSISPVLSYLLDREPSLSGAPPPIGCCAPVAGGFFLFNHPALYGRILSG